MTKTMFELLTDDVTHFLRNPTMVMFLKTEQDKDSQFMKTFFEAAALNKKHQANVKFAFSDIEGEDMQNIVKNMMGIEEEHLPTLRAYVPTGNKKFRCDINPNELTVDGINTWMEDVLQEKVAQVYKSEEVPTDFNSTIVKNIVGVTHEQIVKDPTKDVFVMYYAPWCKYSKEM